MIRANNWYDDSFFHLKITTSAFNEIRFDVNKVRSVLSLLLSLRCEVLGSRRNEMADAFKRQWSG